MALKRSGVRASSAPFHIRTLKPGTETRFILCFRFMFILFLGQYAGFSALRAQNRQREPLFQPAVTILVVQFGSSKQARVAVAYDALLTAQEAGADVERLVKVLGTKALGVRITQEASRKGAKKTTAVDFTLADAPPITNGEPQILPYLMGFQNRIRLEIVFSTESRFAADSFAVADAPEILVRRYTQAQGGIRYEAEVRQPLAQLPGISFASPLQLEGKPTPRQMERKAPVPRSASRALVLGLLVVAGVFFGFAAYINRRK